MANSIYDRKSRWKIYLVVAGLVIIAASMFFTNYLVERLSNEEEKRVKLYIAALENVSKDLSDTTQTCDFTLSSEILTANTTIPIILTDELDGIVDSKNFENEQDTAAIRRELTALRAKGEKPMSIDLPFGKQFLYFKKSNILTQLTYFPWVQVLLIVAFVVAGYLAFSSARRAEQNQVWVGMAKETAHQLGTPISGIIGWIELLKISNTNDDPMTQEAIIELEKDVNRLNTVADRFSKIGAAPTLDLVNLDEIVAKNYEYMAKRMPRKVKFSVIPNNENDPLMANLNAPLFDWVLENLLRNAVDALDNGEGNITISTYREPSWVCIDIADTGKGIARDQFKTVFAPGFSTKKRGWGLGLSLSKRIVKDYHKGQIFVKKSELGKGTCFCIKLPI